MHTSLWRILLLVGGTTIPVALLYEEGFFRGWLWASLRRAKQRKVAILILTSGRVRSLALSSVVLPTGFNRRCSSPGLYAQRRQCRRYLGNVTSSFRLTGRCKRESRGLEWPGLCALWFRVHIGALGISNTAIYGPEIGVLGLLLNVGVAVALWYRCAREGAFATIRSERNQAASVPRSDARRHKCSVLYGDASLQN